MATADPRHRANAPTATTGQKPPDMSTAVYMTTQGGEDTTAAVTESDARLGCESSHIHRVDKRVKFVDFPFTDPDATFSDHLEAVREHSPEIAVAPDIEKGRTLDGVTEKADRLAKHADSVVVVPKSVHPSAVPSRFRVGVPAANYGSGAPFSVWDYRDAGAVHILGGPPARQIEIGRHLTVASVDTATLGQRCRFGMWDGKATDAPDGWDYRRRLRESLDNYAEVWR